MDTQQYKIGIVGLGPTGIILGTHLKQVGCNVAICDLNKEKVSIIQKEGVKLTGAIERTSFFENVFMSCDEFLEEGIDILISCIKTYKVKTLLQDLKKHNNDLILISAQNGIDIGQEYTDCIDESNILRMVLNFAGNNIEPNVVKVTFSTPPHYIASINDSRTDIAQWISSLLTFSGLETQTIDSFALFDEVWKKSILVSAISPLCGISKLTIDEAMKSSDTIEVIEQTILEAMEVAKLEGIQFHPNFVKLCIRELKLLGDHFPSLGVDILKGGPTEIDYNNGKIVEYGKKHYIQTPLNLTFTNLVNAISNKS